MCHALPLFQRVTRRVTFGDDVPLSRPLGDRARPRCFTDWARVVRRLVRRSDIDPGVHGDVRNSIALYPFQALTFRRSTSSRSSLLGLKKGILFGGTWTWAPVFGLRPMRPGLCRVWKLPNPRISILSPDRRARTMPS